MKNLIISQIIIVLFLIGIRIYHYYQIIFYSSQNNNEQLLKGKVISVSKSTSYIKAYLTINLKLDNGSTIAVIQEFRNTLR